MSASRPKVGRIKPKFKAETGVLTESTPVTITPVKTTASRNAGPLAISGAKGSNSKTNGDPKVKPRPPLPINKGKGKGIV